MEERPTSSEPRLRLQHKHGLDEWSPMMPERSAESIVVGEAPADEIYRCQRVGCTEVVQISREDATT
jgi:hypothetical protein